MKVKANQKQKKLLGVLKARVKAFLNSTDRHVKSTSSALQLSVSDNNFGAELNKLKSARNDFVGSSSIEENASATLANAGGEEKIEAQDRHFQFQKALEKFTSQIEVEGKAVFSNSSVNAMFLLKLFLEKDTNLRKDFVWSAKLGHIVNVQLKKPLVVSGNDLPAWCNAIFDCAPFLLPVSVRRQWLGCTSLGVSRTIDWLQKHNKYLSSARDAVSEAERAHNAAIASSNEMQQVQAVALAAQAADRLHEAELKHHVGALRCDLVKVRHDEHLLEDGLFLMNVTRNQQISLRSNSLVKMVLVTVLHKDFFWYSQDFTDPIVNKTVPMWAIDTTESEGVLGNKFGLIPKPLPPRHTDNAEMAQTRAQILNRFKFLVINGKSSFRWLYRSFAANDRIFFLSEGTKAFTICNKFDGGEEWIYVWTFERCYSHEKHAGRRCWCSSRNTIVL